MIIAEKPANMLSEPSGCGNDVVSAIKEQTGAQCFLVHRLDRGTGGAMVLAKDGKTAAKLSEAIQQRDFTKEYLAVIKGTPEEESGVFEDLLFKDSQKNKTFVVARERKGVKAAKLRYKVLSTEGNFEHGVCSLVLAALETGRTHQVRVQFASRKMPLLGDGKYGSRDNRCETALWSFHIAFKHPQSEKYISAISLPPREYPWDRFEVEKLFEKEEKP